MAASFRRKELSALFLLAFLSFNSPKSINNSLSRADNLHEKRVIISSNVAIETLGACTLKIHLTCHASGIKPW